MRLFSDSIGRKVVMAITGLVMVLFVVAHLLGNFSIFAGPNGINAYAEKLHALGALVWVERVVMLAAVILHIVLGLTVTLENSSAKPTAYAVTRRLRATFGGRTMIWTGLILLLFIGYHLLQFTIRVTPDVILQNDAQNRFDVFAMVVHSFRLAPIALVYVVGMIALFLHLSHGIQSSFQTLGLSNAKLLPAYGRWGRVVSVIFLIGFGSIPVLILAGFVAK